MGIFFKLTNETPGRLHINQTLACILFAAIFSVFLILNLQSIALRQAVNHINVSQFKIKIMENILHAAYQPRTDGNSIFFIESHKRDDKVVTLTSRQACSVEAAGEKFPGLNRNCINK